MTERHRQAPSTDAPIRNISRTGTSKSIPKRKDPLPSPTEAVAGVTADDVRARIEKLAYALYQQRGQQDGYDYEDWLEAERRVQAGAAPQSQDGSGRKHAPSLHSA